VGGSQDIDDGDLPNAPEWKWNIVADYHLELESMPFYGFANFSYVWQDEVNFDLFQNPLRSHDSYGVGDLNIGITEKEEERYRITLFVNNIADENYRGRINDFRQLYGGKTAMLQTFPRNSQRYYGLRAKFNF
jgi:iron complex outermembrane receptor protein